MNTRTHAEIATFIWSICNLLRGPYKRNEYRRVILPLTVLRRFDCVLAATKDAVLAADAAYTGESANVRKRLLEDAAGRPFYNRSRLDFERLLADPNQIAQNLSRYIRDFSDNVREIMERFGFEEHIARMNERNLLYQVIQRFATVDLSPGRVDNVQMGYVFEELIRIGAEQANEEAGEHFTPREVIRLMVSLLLSPEPDLGTSHVVKTIYDPACGTGGMLSVAEDYLREHNSEANPILFGQDWNDDAWAVCTADMLIKGENAENIILGDSFTEDGYPRGGRGGRPSTFDYMLANPPFGVEWKQHEQEIRRERDTLGFQGRFGAGLPRINDGSLLFLQHILSKMRPVDEGGSRIAIVFNGSPLFAGDAGGGESSIRQWIIENDWLEAIVALPDQLFYNTGISTYIWVLTNRKEPRRRGKVQLIDGRRFFVKMRRSLGNKRNELSPEQIDDLTRIHGTFEDGETRALTDEDPVTHEPRTRPRVVSRVFANEDFGHRKVTVERPLRLNFAATEERIARIEDERAFQNLAKSKKRTAPAHDAEVAEGQARQEAIRGLLHSSCRRDRRRGDGRPRGVRRGAAGRRGGRGLQADGGGAQGRAVGARRARPGGRGLPRPPRQPPRRTPSCATRRPSRSARTSTATSHARCSRTCRTRGSTRARRRSATRSRSTATSTCTSRLARSRRSRRTCRPWSGRSRACSPMS